MAARSDKSGKGGISMRFSEMTSLDDDDDLDLFTASNHRAKPGTSNVSAPSIRDSARRPTSIHDNKKDSGNKRLFGDIKGKIPAAISRKLEELTPEEKFRDVKHFLARKASEDGRNQPPLTNIFGSDDFDFKSNNKPSSNKPSSSTVSEVPFTNGIDEKLGTIHSLESIESSRPIEPIVPVVAAEIHSVPPCAPSITAWAESDRDMVEDTLSLIADPLGIEASSAKISFKPESKTHKEQAKQNIVPDESIFDGSNGTETNGDLDLNSVAAVSKLLENVPKYADESKSVPEMKFDNVPKVSSVPKVETAIPIPKVEAVIPKVDVVIPKVEAAMPKVEAPTKAEPVPGIEIVPNAHKTKEPIPCPELEPKPAELKSIDSKPPVQQNGEKPVEKPTPPSRLSAEKTDKLSPPKTALSPPTPNDPLNVFLREMNQRRNSSDLDTPPGSPRKLSPKSTPKTGIKGTHVSGTSTPKSNGSRSNTNSPKIAEKFTDSIEKAEKFVDVSGELSDVEFEPMEDFFGTIDRRASDSRAKRPRVPATRRSSNPLNTSVNTPNETSSMSFSALKTETNRTPEKLTSDYDTLDDFRPTKEVIKNVSETLNKSNDENLSKETDAETKLKFREEVLEVPTSSMDMSSSSLRKYWKLSACTVLLLAYAMTPLPSYVSGLVTGMLISGMLMTLYMMLTKPPREKESFSVAELNSLPPFLLPEIKDCRFDEGIYKGWMNELSHYDAENYHINDTCSVYVTLEGSTLRLQRPKTPVPKRAMWNESITSPKFIHQRYYDIIGATITLEPADLVKKRLWSKKYPVCLTMKTDKKDLERSGRMTSSPSKEEMTDFEVVDKAECSLTLYLFARTCREKEDWYRRFIAAAKGQPLVNHLPELSKLTYANNAQVSFQNVDELISTVSELREDYKDSDKKRMVDYARFMAKFMPADHMVKTLGCSHKDLARLGHVICDSQLIWLNALIGRVLWDLLREKFWAEKVYEKIQKKLSKIHVPIFINEITITDLELGTEVPIVRRASKPYLDARGLWIDLDLAYAGGFKMTLETKCNLMKLKKHGGGARMYAHVQDRSDKSAVFNSEEEDSCESSTEEEDEIPVETDNGERLGVGGGKKFLRIVDKITNSKYFQQATENKYIRRAMEGVSNTPLVLSVEVHSLIGTLAVNIPAPPTDRVWYGFRTNPRLLISAKPKVGDRQVTVTHVTDWIERKINSEFQKILVLPNMDDIPVPVMNEGAVNNS